MRGAVSGSGSRFPAFRPRAPWYGPDLQTLRNFLRRPDPTLDRHPATRLRLPMRDGTGDALSALLQHPAEAVEWEARPVVVLIHGLSGNEDSTYMRTSAAHWLGTGFRVVRLNLRGAGPSRAGCRQQYHAGRSGDLRDAFATLGEEVGGDGFAIVGYSLGGNVTLKFLAEYGAEFDVRVAASVSAPIDLLAASRRINEPRNRLYQWNLLRNMKLEANAVPGGLDEGERSAVQGARSVLGFDDAFVAPRNGYPDAYAYYEANSAMHFLDEIRTPTLMIHALDDPWIPARAYQAQSWAKNPALVPLLAAGGGHVGFHAPGTRVPWHDRCIERFFSDAVG